MNKIILAATLLAVSSAVSAQQQNPPDRPTVQGNNPSTRTNEGGSSYTDTKAPAKAMAPAPASNSAAAAPAATTTTTTAPATPAPARVARAPKADRN
jgi:hypothetical protein